jgi:Acetamidase/Formamidase family
MLGCVGVAPRFDAPPISSRDLDYFGGNLDFAEVTDGATVLLPVSIPGALLYVGDAHAVQGDGEVTGSALETSLDIEISVEILRGKRWKVPRVETDQYIMSLGLEARSTRRWRARPPISPTGSRSSTSSGPRRSPRSSARRSSTGSPRSPIGTSTWSPSSARSGSWASPAPARERHRHRSLTARRQSPGHAIDGALALGTQRWTQTWTHGFVAWCTAYQWKSPRGEVNAWPGCRSAYVVACERP